MKNKELVTWMGSILNELDPSDEDRLVEALVFAKKVAKSEPDYDFIPMSRRFLHFLISNWRLSSQLTREEAQYIADVDALYKSHKIIALKIVMINIALAITGKYVEVFTHISSRLHAWLSDEAISRVSRIEWGTQLWINLPYARHAYDKDQLIERLYPLFIEEAKSSPGFIASQFDLITVSRGDREPNQRWYLFNQFVENPVDFVQLARLIHAEKPTLLLHGLQRCLWEGSRYQRSIQNKIAYDSAYQPTETFLRAVANELFNMLDSNSPNEALCQRLLLEAYPDEEWYPSLFARLWAIEKQKKQPDDNSIKNCFIVSLNSPSESALKVEAETQICDWAFRYKTLDLSNHELFIKRAKTTIKLVNDACHPVYPFTRNRYLPSHLDQKAIKLVIDAYWEMVDWLRASHVTLALYALLGGASANTFATQLTTDIAHDSQRQLINLFKTHAARHLIECAAVVERMIRGSSSSDYKHDYSAMLDQLYPVLYSISPSAAKKALERGEVRGSHSSPWRPKFNGN